MNFNIYNKGDRLKKEGYLKKESFQLKKTFVTLNFSFVRKEKLIIKRKEPQPVVGWGLVVQSAPGGAVLKF